ncbi:MAG: hypothetical protein ABEJ08_02170 [Halobacteriaceae archaeon]
MSLRCSLLGHDFGDPETEREREERGDEAVTTVREVRTCRRCGERRVLSENTEVTHVGDDTSADAGPASHGTESGEAASQSATPVGDADTATPADDSAPQSGGGSAPSAASGAGGGYQSGGDATTDDTAPEDDAIILGDEADQPPDRDAGEWPGADDADDRPASGDDDAGVSSADGPTVSEAAEETTSARAETVDGDPLTGDQAVDQPPGPTVGDPDTGSAGEDAGAAGPDAEPDEAGADVLEGESGDPERDATGRHQSEGAGSETPEPDPDATGPSDIRAADEAGAGADEVDVDAELTCPNCGFSEGALGSSHRRGDICPECRKGYLAER